MTNPYESITSLKIGTVFFVSPDEIKVQLELNAPEAVALNAGTPRPFPRINSYLLIPSDNGFIVGQVEWITIENSPYPKRQGMQDFGLIDLPFPLRKLCLNPIGTLVRNEMHPYVFERGVTVFPSVGDDVLLPTIEQLKSIVTNGERRRVKIGTSPLAGNSDVTIDPDRLFGRHIAVLGNTGSGKSCSVAGLIRWSIEAAKKHMEGDTESPNSHFIILDPNGEYSNTFNDLNAKKFRVSDESIDEQLSIPIWFCNLDEWCAFVQATDKTQKPILLQALRTVRSGTIDEVPEPSKAMRHYLRILLGITNVEYHNGGIFGKFPAPKNFCENLKKWGNDLIQKPIFSDAENEVLHSLQQYINQLTNARVGQYPTYTFTKSEIDKLIEYLSRAHKEFGGTDSDFSPISADTPIQFTGEEFIKAIEVNAELLNVADYTETMVMRIKSILSDTRLKSVLSDNNDCSLASWLENYIGNSTTPQITIIDLSLLPADVINIITALIARMIFETLQRYRKLDFFGRTFPTVLVMEEAHTFIKRYHEDNENRDSSILCCKVFEKIAREGRKFGLGLMLSSQRPSELSPTVLSQCNTFLLHRISNDKDQELIHHLLPDNLRGLLRDLPILPARMAILMGWATELPVLVKMNELDFAYRPQSEDPDFWDVWTRKAMCETNWQMVADDWQGKTTDDNTEVFDDDPQGGDHSLE